MYSFAQEREVERMKFSARIMGIDVDADQPDSTGETPAPQRIPFPQSDLLFRHPSEYAKMTDLEKQELSERMMGKHKASLRSTPLGRGTF